MGPFRCPLLGHGIEPSTHRDKLMDYNCWALMTGTDRVATLDGWVLFVATALESYGINPRGRHGQSTLQEFVKNARREIYGTLDHWAYCDWCGEPYHQELSIRFVNR